MPRDARFWRNVTIIAVAHIAILIALVRWNRETRPANLQSIVWMSGGGTDVAAQSLPAQTETAIETTPPPETDAPPRSKPEEQDEPPVPTLAKSDLQLPPATPSPTPVATPLPKPSLTPVPKASPKSTAKPTPKATPKKTVVAKATPKPSPKKKATPAEQEKKNDESRERGGENHARQRKRRWRRKIRINRTQRRGASVGIQLVRKDAARPFLQFMDPAYDQRCHRSEDVRPGQNSDRERWPRLELHDCETVRQCGGG